jgi:hypothetical protein
MAGWTMGESGAFVSGMYDAKREAEKHLPLEYQGGAARLRSVPRRWAANRDWS